MKQARIYIRVERGRRRGRRPHIPPFGSYILAFKCSEFGSGLHITDKPVREDCVNLFGILFPENN